MEAKKVNETGEINFKEKDSQPRYPNLSKSISSHLFAICVIWPKVRRRNVNSAGARSFAKFLHLEVSFRGHWWIISFPFGAHDM